MIKDNLGDRMKENYENRYRINLTRRTPVIIRLDGKSFHTLTRNCNKPFDEFFNLCMRRTAEKLLQEVQGAKLVYTQSDEISLLLSDFNKLSSEAWFNYNLQKIVSISSSIASIEFSKWFMRNAYFDSRAFNIPKEEVNNYFIWRQQDWIRNSIQMLARSHFTNKELHKKNTPAIHEMLHEKNVNWNDLDPKWKNGTTIYRRVGDSELQLRRDVIFKVNRGLIDKLLTPEEV